MLVLDGIAKSFGAVRAVDDLSFEVAEGELLAVLGPSGSGKSTALRIVAGLEEPDAGRVLIDGRDVTHEEPGARGVAMVFQSFALFPHMTVGANVAFGLEARGVPRDDRDRRVAEAAEVLGLGDLLGRRPAELSGGERQRTALARALAARPRVLLMDEPLSNLDAPLRERARAEIRRLHRETRAAVVYVTHDQAEALSLGDRVAMVDQGTVRQIADPDTLYERPGDVVVARFVGAPPMNVLRATVEGGALSLDGSGRLALPAAASAAEGRAVLAGFRAEDARCPAEGAEGVDGVVDAVERAGRDHVWHVVLGAERVAVHPRPGASAEPGAPVRIAVDPAALRLFDPDTGAAL